MSQETLSDNERVDLEKLRNIFLRKPAKGASAKPARFLLSCIICNTGAMSHSSDGVTCSDFCRDGLTYFLEEARSLAGGGSSAILEVLAAVCELRERQVVKILDESACVARRVAKGLSLLLPDDEERAEESLKVIATFVKELEGVAEKLEAMPEIEVR